MMNHWRRLWLPLLLLSLFYSTQDPPLAPRLAPAHAAATAQSEIDAIRECFEIYRQALLDQNGAIAAQQLSQGTIDYYGSMKALALYGTAETVQKESLANQYLILSLRHRVPAGELQTLSAEDVIALAVQEGWIGKESVADTNIDEIIVNGSQATAKPMILGEPEVEGPQFHFIQEASGWKLDLLPLMNLAEAIFQLLVEQQDLPPQDGLLQLLENISGRPTSPALWQPLLKQP